jgi:hypothetical protein
MTRLFQVLVLSIQALAAGAQSPFVPPAEMPAAQAQSVTQQLRQLAASTTHLATDYILHNRWSDRRWPAETLREQEQLVAALPSMGRDREALRAALGDPDPRVRTLALAALYVREDPQDLPLIAALQKDTQPTLMDLRANLRSDLGPFPLSEFEEPQSVGDVAFRMIQIYLFAAGETPWYLTVDMLPTYRDAARETSAFEKYWGTRATRQWCPSWILVRVVRATRQTTPMSPRYEADIARVRAEIDALPPLERAWTLLYIWPSTQEYQRYFPDAGLIAALKQVGPDALMKLVRREPFSDHPDLRPELGDTPRAAMTYSKIVFVLINAADLLRASDADTVLAESRRDPTRSSATLWISATAQLRGLADMGMAVSWLKEQIAAIPPASRIGARSDQAALATTLWRMRGAAERDYLSDWFYAALPEARLHLVHGPQDFLRAIQKYRDGEIAAMLATIVRDPRFDRTDWGTLAEILKLVNRSRPTPLVETRTIHDYDPASRRPDEAAVLASWRSLLRQHFGG